MEPRQWGSDYLDVFCTELLKKLLVKNPEIVTALKCDGPGNEFRWGSGCSGTDSPRWVYSAIAQALQREVPNNTMSFKHECSAECVPIKRDFVNAFATPGILTADIFELCLEDVRNFAGGRVCQCDPIRELQDMDCFIAGFVCKSVSALNSMHWEAARSAIWDEHTKTGSTLWAVILFLERCRPKSFILENVFGLKRKMQHEVVLERLRNSGYAAYVRESNPLEYQHPQDRDRLYFQGFRIDLVEAAGISSDRVVDIALGWHDQLLSTSAGREMTSLDSFLLKEDDTYIVQSRQKKLEKVISGPRPASVPKSSGSGPSPKWVAKHRQQSIACYKSNYDDSKVTEYPDYALLPDRIKDLLDFEHLEFPDKTQAILNCSQSKITRGRNGSSPTVTPRCTMWITHRARLCVGRELMALQGLHIDPAQYDELALSDNQIADLAGNAFCTVCCATEQLVGICMLALLEGKRSGLQAELEVALLGSGSDDGDDDDALAAEAGAELSDSGGSPAAEAAAGPTAEVEQVQHVQQVQEGAETESDEDWGAALPRRKRWRITDMQFDF
jgi:site-specific DNA-cytosine methylase